MFLVVVGIGAGTGSGVGNCAGTGVGNDGTGTCALGTKDGTGAGKGVEELGLFIKDSPYPEAGEAGELETEAGDDSTTCSLLTAAPLSLSSLHSELGDADEERWPRRPLCQSFGPRMSNFSWTTRCLWSLSKGITLGFSFNSKSLG